jgi:hypothetical protein
MPADTRFSASSAKNELATTKALQLATKIDGFLPAYSEFRFDPRNRRLGGVIRPSRAPIKKKLGCVLCLIEFLDSSQNARLDIIGHSHILLKTRLLGVYSSYRA